jgi:hypothetical protein
MRFANLGGAVVAVLTVGCAVAERSVPATEGSEGGEPASCPRLNAPASESPQSGDPCTFVGPCGGSNNLLCSYANWDCQNGIVFAETSELIDCPVDPPIATTAVPWTDCQAAVASARTQDPCGWQGACAETTDDPCCVHVAICGMSPGPDRHVYRYRMCAPGCSRLTADSTGPVLTACPGAELAPGNSIPQMHLGQPCTGDFLCVDQGPFSNEWFPASAYTEFDYGSGVEWCAGGVIVGSRMDAFMIGPWG